MAWLRFAQTDKRQDILHRLAVSYGLATSVKLNSFERAIEKTVSETQRIPEVGLGRGWGRWVCVSTYVCVCICA